MIESLMLMALGFLIATLFALVAAQFVWRRAVKVTTRRLESHDGAANETARMAELDTLLKRQERETQPLQAEIERLGAQNRELAAANDDLARENSDLIERNRLLQADREALQAAIDERERQAATLAATMAGELATLERAIDEEARRHAETLNSLGASAAALGGTLQQPAPAQAPEILAVQQLEPYPAAEGESEADADARTLAEVKASLLAELEDGEEPETAETGRDPATADAHISDRTLAARIRALEAGVQ